LEYTRSDIYNTLDALNIHYVQDSGEWVKLQCVNTAHEDSTPSAGINVETGVYNCLGCRLKTNIVKIVQNIYNCTYKEAENFVKTQSFDYIPQNVIFQPKQSTEIKKPKEKKLTVKTSLETFPLQSEKYNYTSQRGFTKDFCEEFNITHCISNFYTDYFIVPIIDSKKKINLFEARKLMQYEKLQEYYKSSDSFKNLSKQFKRECKRRKLKLENQKLFENNKEIFSIELTYLLQKKVLYPKGVSINTTIFNIDNLDRKKPLYVVEGFGSVPKIYLNISKNVTCTFGAVITEDQMDYLKEFKEILLLNDNDFAGYKMAEQLGKEHLNAYTIPIISEDTDDSYVKDILSTPQFLCNIYANRKLLLGNYKKF
jgi:5S rRNA maturation endonuclease (ribonuclease M5)